jgi:hypothetical protein
LSGNDNRGATVLLQYREDVLKEVELLVACACPEIVAVDDKRLSIFFAGVVDDGDATSDLEPCRPHSAKNSLTRISREKPV